MVFWQIGALVDFEVQGLVVSNKGRANRLLGARCPEVDAKFIF
jgi:hypothetical protein